MAREPTSNEKMQQKEQTEQRMIVEMTRAKKKRKPNDCPSIYAIECVLLF